MELLTSPKTEPARPANLRGPYFFARSSNCVFKVVFGTESISTQRHEGSPEAAQRLKTRRNLRLIADDPAATERHSSLMPLLNGMSQSLLSEALSHSINFAGAMNSLQAGRYRHYKGNDYLVIGVARHSETEEELVVYRQDYGDRGLWVRPLAMFQEEVEINGRRIPRFEYAGPE
jgi:hypothetical protein